MNEEKEIIQDIRNGELKKYICPLVYCPATSMMIIGTHEISLSRLAVMKTAYELLNIKHLSKYELKKPFLIAYWNAFGRVV